MNRLFEKHADGTETLTLPEDFAIFLRMATHRILVRRDYARLILELNGRADRWAQRDRIYSRPYARGVVIAGDSGIGRYSISSNL
jgi:hypothetical protein